MLYYSKILMLASVKRTGKRNLPWRMTHDECPGLLLTAVVTTTTQYDGGNFWIGNGDWIPRVQIP